MGVFDIVTGGLGILGGAASELDEYKQGQKMVGLLEDQLPDIAKAEQYTKQMFDIRSKLLGTQKSNRLGELGFKTGRSMFDLFESARGIESKSGFSGSGAIERGKERGLEGIQTQHEFGSQSIYDLFAERQLSAQERRDAQLAQLSQQRRSIEMQMASIDQEEPGFLTKVIGGVGDFLGL